MDRSFNLLEDGDTEPALGIAECLVNARRKSVQYASRFVHVDNPDVVSIIVMRYFVAGTVYEQPCSNLDAKLAQRTIHSMID
jgi:hypothetical protein